MTIKTNSIFNVAAILPIMFGVCSALFMAYVFYWPPAPAYSPSKPETHSVTYHNDFIRIHREYCINQRIPITINRDLIRVGAPNEPELRYTLPQTKQTYELGCHAVDRIFDFPDYVPSGNYRLAFTATWRANPFRTDTIDLPELTVAIPPRTK